MTELYKTDLFGRVSTDTLAGWASKAARHMGIATEMAWKWENAKKALLAEPAYKSAPVAEKRKLREINWGMKDALASYNWHINEANRLHQAIIAQHALREMGKS